MKVGYIRVSRKEQAENSHALEQQELRVKNTGVEKIYQDIDSGSKDKRIDFNQLLEDIEGGLVTQLVVTRLDRLTRSLVTLRKVIAKVEEAGCELIALDDHIDTSSAAGRFQINMLGSLAEMEVDRLSERIRHGWQHLRDRKVAMNPPFGYIKVGESFELDTNPFLCLLEGKKELSKYALALQIIDFFLEARSLRGTIRLINETFGIFTTSQGNGRKVRGLFRFSHTGLNTWLNNPVIRGHTCYLRKRKGKRLPLDKWIIYQNTHQPLITEEKSAIINSILLENRQRRGFGSTAPIYPLSGLVVCGECRCVCYSISASRGKTPGKNYYYQCRNWGTRACSQKKTIRMEKIEDLLVKKLITRAEEISKLTVRSFWKPAS